MKSSKNMMRKAILSAWVAVLPALLYGGGALGAQEKAIPPQEKAAPPPQSQTLDNPQDALRPAKPATPAAAETLPADLAAPKPSGGVKIPGAAPVDTKTYVIGAEDVIFVKVWRDNDVSGQFLVRPDGRISVPLIGDVTATDRTPEQLEKDISERLADGLGIIILVPDAPGPTAVLHRFAVGDPDFRQGRINPRPARHANRAHHYERG